MFRFGPIPAPGCDEDYSLDVSSDRRALTFNTPGLLVAVGGCKAPDPISAKQFSKTLPLVGDDERAE
ncbi:MAG TPA: hypothetical protein VNC50_09390, partial [Planctomycetia bacterium]|nr:hypothetical protein [Planctomycetia bacterium]